MKKIIWTAVLVLAVGAMATAADVQVIANPGVTALDVSAAELKEVFLGSRAAVGSGAVEPVLAQGGAAHEAFLKTYLGKSDQALKSHFKTLVFTGKGSMPKSLPSDAEIVKYVAATKGAIGYVGADTDLSGVRKLTVK